MELGAKIQPPKARDPQPSEAMNKKLKKKKKRGEKNQVQNKLFFTLLDSDNAQIF